MHNEEHPRQVIAPSIAPAIPESQSALARRLNLFDAVMIGMGGIICAGIFINPSVVERQLHSPVLVMAAWLTGGAVALMCAFVYSDLPGSPAQCGRQYAYARV